CSRSDRAVHHLEPSPIRPLAGSLMGARRRDAQWAHPGLTPSATPIGALPRLVPMATRGASRSADAPLRVQAPDRRETLLRPERTAGDQVEVVVESPDARILQVIFAHAEGSQVARG